MSEQITELNYRPFVTKTYWGLLLLLFVVELLIVRANIGLFAEGSWLHIVVRLVIASTVILSILFRLLIFVRPRIFSSYRVYPDQLIITHGRKEKLVQFNQIKSISFSFLPARLGGGFSLHLQDGGKLVFMTLLENNHKVLEVVQKQAPQLVQGQRAQTYLRNCQLMGVSWQRMAEKAKNWKLVLVKYLMYPLLWSTLFYWGSFGKSEVGFVLVDYMYTLLGCWLVLAVLAVMFNELEEKWVTSHLQQDGAGEIKRDLVDETKAAIVLEGGYYLFTVVALLVYFKLVS